MESQHSEEPHDYRPEGLFVNVGFEKLNRGVGVVEEEEPLS